ncbi:MAG: response regulator [Ginsengibacter sp.]
MAYTNTILLVDDSEIILKVLSFMIRKAGYNVLSASDGKKALKFLDGGNIDLAFTDLNMPEMNGIELITEIRRTERYRFMPVVLFIDDKEKERKTIMETSGATMLLDKNDIKEKVISTIKTMLD